MEQRSCSWVSFIVGIDARKIYIKLRNALCLPTVHIRGDSFNFYNQQSLTWSQLAVEYTLSSVNILSCTSALWKRSHFPLLQCFVLIIFWIIEE